MDCSLPAEGDKKTKKRSSNLAFTKLKNVYFFIIQTAIAEWKISIHSLYYGLHTGAQHFGAQQVGAQQVGAQHLGAQQVGAQQAGAQHFGAQQVGAQQVGAQQVGAQQVGGQHVCGAQHAGFWQQLLLPVHLFFMHVNCFLNQRFFFFSNLHILPKNPVFLQKLPLQQDCCGQQG